MLYLFAFKEMYLYNEINRQADLRYLDDEHNCPAPSIALGVYLELNLSGILNNSQEYYIFSKIKELS